MAAAPELPKTLEVPYRWGSVEGIVRIEVGRNEDPAAFGCSEVARGFPYCLATVDHPKVGYADVLGWVQLVDSSAQKPGFHLDYFEPLGRVPHPFAFYGWSQPLLDAPHSDEVDDWDFLAHSFLCGLGGELLERKEVRAVLGFSWGFSKRGQQINWFGPTALSPEDWNGHCEYLSRKHRWRWWRPWREGWTFAPGFLQDPLRP